MPGYPEHVQSADADVLRSALFEFASRYPSLQDELVNYLQRDGSAPGPAGAAGAGGFGAGSTSIGGSANGNDGGKSGGSSGKQEGGARSNGFDSNGFDAGANNGFDNGEFDMMQQRIMQGLNIEGTGGGGSGDVTTTGGSGAASEGGRNSASSELQRLLSDHTVLSIGLNTEGVISRWSRRAAEVIGYSEQQALGKKLSLAPFIARSAHVSFPPIVDAAIALCMNEGKVNFSDVLGCATVPLKTVSGKFVDAALEIRPVSVGGSMHLILLQQHPVDLALEYDLSDAPPGPSASAALASQSSMNQLGGVGVGSSVPGSSGSSAAAVMDNGQRPPWYQYRNRPGCIFGANKDTFDECINRRLLGLPAHYMKMVMSIVPNETVLFLFNFTTRYMFGIFVATERGGEHEPNAWCTNGDQRTPFPAQIRFKIVHKYPPLIESAFADLMEYRPNTRHFRFQLRPEQTTALLDRFGELAGKQ